MGGKGLEGYSPYPAGSWLFATFVPNQRILTREAEISTHAKNNTTWYLWPFTAIWKLLAIIVEMTGRLVAMILGIVLMIVGVLVSLTIVGAIIGIPLAIVGLLLFLRGIF